MPEMPGSKSRVSGHLCLLYRSDSLNMGNPPVALSDLLLRDSGLCIWRTLIDSFLNEWAGLRMPGERSNRRLCRFLNGSKNTYV